MNATPKRSPNVRIDADIFIEVLLHIDPNAASGHSKAYRKVRAKLLSFGWKQQRLDKAIAELRSKGRLFLSVSRKTVSLKPINSLGAAYRCCAYCGKRTKNLTKDHVIPKSKGGANGSSNIVLACEPCNRVKADRTPVQWARDILNFRNRVS